MSAPDAHVLAVSEPDKDGKRLLTLATNAGRFSFRIPHTEWRLLTAVDAAQEIKQGDVA